MGPSGCGKCTPFSWMIGALAEQFSCTGELWLNEQRIDYPTHRTASDWHSFSGSHCLFDQFSVGHSL
ncbi:hypothetical protein [Escherichia coli]|uniref:hypothetical protein n=1 Tax=Escherichia coli TaxID=562 RepID=UPI003F63F2E0